MVRKCRLKLRHEFLLKSGLNHLAPDRSFPRKFAPRHGEFAEYERKEGSMSHRKTKQCIAAMQAILKRGGLEPEQELAIRFAILRLKRLSRLKKADNRNVYECVADISEKLVNAFCRSKD